MPNILCEVCGLPQSNPGICPSCHQSPPPFLALRSWAVYEGSVRSALHSIKYHRNIALGETLARPVAEYVRRLGWPVDMVVPVPLGRKRLRERGYNQVALLAMPLAAINGWRYAPKVLARVRETKSQVGLPAEERLANVSGAFDANVRQVENHIVLVMDDIATTGATISSCSQALLGAGAKSVYALTLARALPHDGFTHVYR